MLRTDLSIALLLATDWEHDTDLLKSPWFDWFCPDEQLVRASRKLVPRVAELAGGLRFNKDLYRVFFNTLYEPTMKIEVEHAAVLAVCQKHV